MVELTRAREQVGRARAAGRTVLLALAWGCGGDDTFVDPVVRELSLVTFNAALGVGLAPYLEERLALVERDLPALDADVVCLQELWRPEDIDRLTAALASEFPHAHFSVQSEGGAGGGSCSEAEASVLTTCLTDNCADVERAALPLCAISNCQPAFAEVSASCQQCIAANQSATGIEQLAALCSAEDGEVLAYRDQTGLLLLSKLPLLGASYSAFESSLGDRGVLSAQLDTDFAGVLDVHCTHLAASLGELPYMGEYGSFEGERLRQIEQFGELLQAREGDRDGAILLGDMNCGPSTSQARAASPDAFERFVTAGFVAPYVAADGRCTFCSNNPLNDFGADGAEQGAIIDHVLLSSVPAESVLAAERVFEERVVLAAAEGEVESARSDHYGVRVRIGVPAEEPAP